MPKLQEDQAAGLRRLMTSYQPKIVTVLSATSSESNSGLLVNLAASINEHDCDVLILHAGQVSREALRPYGIEAIPSLYDVAHQRSALAQSVKSSKLGFSISKLFSKNQKHTAIESNNEKQLNKVFNNLASLFEVVLIDASLDKNNLLPLDILNDNKILIQLTRDAESIKQGYSLIKQIYSQIGRRSFGIIVVDATDAQAALVFRNISQVARQYMQIELEFFGAIPADQHIDRAAKLGRAITDAFPASNAAKAFKALAQRLNYKQNQPAKVELASFI